jgi:endonuclease YncB( thermonuclease family)
MKRLLVAACWLGVACAAGPAQATDQAWVSWVMDGDTVLLLPEGEREPVKFRLQGIDAPESCQPGGEASRDALIALVLRRTVRVEAHGQDSYGRQLGRLWVGDQEVGAEMVRAGWAWAYSYRTGRGPHAALQREAERARRGLFAARETAMSPSVFRQFHGSCHAEAEAQAPVVRVPQTRQAGSR